MQAISILFGALIFFISTGITLANEISLAEALRTTRALTLCGEAVPMNLSQVRERYEKELLLNLGDRPQVLLWIKRCNRYMPYIEDALKSKGLPDDIKYLAVAESALRPHAGSSKGAMGIWQLMPATARKYGLTVDAYKDERRNIYLATPVAINYLIDLKEQFSSWSLALAAYNMGEEGLTTQIMEQKTSDYYNLYLPLETQRFIFRILAIKQILSNTEHYGFQLKPEERYSPLDFDSIDIECREQTPIQIVAEAANTFFKTIKELNPHLRGYFLQAGHQQINLPKGSAPGFKKRFEELSVQYTSNRRSSMYVVQPGDSLSAISDRFNVPLAAILIWNQIKVNNPIHPGDQLVIYSRKIE